MSIKFEGHILYSSDPKRISRMLVGLFDGELVGTAKDESLIVVVAGIKFFLRSHKTDLENFKYYPTHSFCFEMTHSEFFEEFEDRYQFFIFKEETYQKKISHLERLQKIENHQYRGFIIVDEDGRTWTLLDRSIDSQPAFVNSKQSDKFLSEGLV